MEEDGAGNTIVSGWRKMVRAIPLQVNGGRWCWQFLCNCLEENGAGNTIAGRWMKLVLAYFCSCLEWMEEDGSGITLQVDGGRWCWQSHCRWMEEDGNAIPLRIDGESGSGIAIVGGWRNGNTIAGG